MDTQPNPTLYIQGLDTKTSKDDLRHLLYIYFSSYGKVLDVVAVKNDKMRGQAFVVFKDLQTSTAALRKEDGRVFAGKPLRISYAKGKSYATIEKESGKEALYQYRMGIVKDPEGAKRLTVSGAGKELDRVKNKRSKDEQGGEEEEEDEEDAGGAEGSAAKRIKTNGQAGDEDDDAMEVESEDDDDDAPGPAPA